MLICLSVCPTPCPSVCLPLCLQVSLSPSLYLSVCLPVCLYMYDCLAVCLSTCLSTSLPACLCTLSVCRLIGWDVCLQIPLYLAISVFHSTCLLFIIIAISFFPHHGHSIHPSICLAVCTKVPLPMGAWTGYTMIINKSPIPYTPRSDPSHFCVNV